MCAHCKTYCIITLYVLQSVELISSDTEHTPFLMSPQNSRHHDRRSQDAMSDIPVCSLQEGMEGTEWAVMWRGMVRQVDSESVPLPLPKSKQYFASLKDMFRPRSQQQAPFHRYRTHVDYT